MAKPNDAVPEDLPQWHDPRLENLDDLLDDLLEEGDVESLAALLDPNVTAEDEAVALSIAARAMGVSEAEVRMAQRVQREDPKLFEKILNGQITLNAALLKLDAATDDETKRRARELERQLDRLLSDPDVDPALLKCLAQILDDYGISD